MQQEQIEWRRSQVLELSSMGHNQAEIAKLLRLDKSIVSRDIAHIREQCKDNIKKYIDEKLPQEYEKCLIGLTAILKESWNIAQNTQDKREKIQALSLAKECYNTKLELLTNATVVDDAINFVSSNSNLSNKIEKEKAKEDDVTIANQQEYDVQGSEEKDNSGTIITSNQVF